MPKPEFRVNNIIIGALNVDLVSRIESTNHSTSDTCELTFETKNKKCILSGFGFDKRGNKLFEISGSWQDKITVKNIRTCSNDVIWQEDKQKIPLNSSQQYDFNHEFSLGLNELTPEMKKTLPPTDSRLRPD